MNLNVIFNFLSDIGESAVLLALVTIGSIYLVILHRFREAGAVLLSFFLSSSLIAILKLVFIGCGTGLYQITSPSGHTALSLSVYGTFAMLIYIRLRGHTRYIAPLPLIGIAALISVSRVIQNLHTINEVMIGTCVGLVTLGTSWYFLLHDKREMVEARREPKFIRLHAIPALIIVTIFLMQGTKLPAERMVRNLAMEIKKHISYCQD